MSSAVTAEVKPMPLILEPSPDFPRRLQIAQGVGTWMNCSVFSKRGRMLAFASAELPECRLTESTVSRCLWIGSAAFDLSDREFERVRNQFDFRVESR